MDENCLTAQAYSEPLPSLLARRRMLYMVVVGYEAVKSDGVEWPVIRLGDANQ